MKKRTVNRRSKESSRLSRSRMPDWFGSETLVPEVAQSLPKVPASWHRKGKMTGSTLELILWRIKRTLILFAFVLSVIIVGTLALAFVVYRIRSEGF